MKSEENLRILMSEIERLTGETCIPEYPFHPQRKWRLDLALPMCRVALEIQGGVWVRGKHGRGDGIFADHEKANEAQLAGWVVIQCQPRQVASRETVELILRAVRLQREQLADWLPDTEIAMPSDPARADLAADLADRTFHGRSDSRSEITD